MLKTLTIMDEDGNYHEVEFPAKHKVCIRCEGHGTYLHPSIGEHAYTSEEFEESFDEEQRAEYFKRGGIYDVTCEECQGQRVTVEVAEEKLSPEQRVWYQLFLDNIEEELKFEAMCAAERRMGA